MKAGTAQRIALNLLSSMLMIQLGRVYEGLMVDVQAMNTKLVRRSERMLTQLTGRSGQAVRDALAKADGSVKLAFLLLQSCDLDDARQLLDRAGGRLREAMELMGQRDVGQRVVDAPDLQDTSQAFIREPRLMPQDEPGPTSDLPPDLPPRRGRG
jgi:N-acetylmuramic acid 6-phosphate etherase